MKEKLNKLPPPLRKQALLRVCRSGACFCLLLLVCSVVPSTDAVVPLSGDGCFFRRQRRPVGVEGRSGKGPGRGRRLQRSGANPVFRRRPKAVVMECGDRLVKVYLHARVRNLAVGERLRFYVAESAPVYEEDDVLVLAGIWR